MAGRFMTDFKRFFVRGLAAMLPALLTIIIIVYVVQFVYKYIGRYVNFAVQWVVVQYLTIRQGQGWDLWGHGEVWRRVAAPQTGVWDRYYLWIIGFVLAFVVIYIFGRFIASIIGRGVWRMIERSFFSLPVVKGIYPSVKQVTDFLLAERKMEFSRVVAVEYPRKGIWSMGLVTGEGMRTIQSAVGGDLLTVFIPSSPTPVTGYTITVRRDEIVDLPLSIDDALRFTISGGVIMPPSQRFTETELRHLRRGAVPLLETKEKPA